MPEHSTLTGSNLHEPGPHTHVAADVTDLPSGVGGGGAPDVQYYDVVLTDEQIKALPSTAADLIPAPGAGLAIVVQSVYLRSNIVTGYANLVEDGATLQFILGNRSWAFINDNATSGWMNVTDLLLYGRLYVVPPAFRTNAEINALEVIEFVEDGAANAPLTMNLYNGTNSDLTEGDPSNTLSMRIWYRVVPLVISTSGPGPTSGGGGTITTATVASRVDDVDIPSAVSEQQDVDVDVVGGSSWNGSDFTPDEAGTSFLYGRDGLYLDCLSIRMYAPDGNENTDPSASLFVSGQWWGTPLFNNVPIGTNDFISHNETLLRVHYVGDKLGLRITNPLSLLACHIGMILLSSHYVGPLPPGW